MANSMYGVSAYQQTNQAWNKTSGRSNQSATNKVTAGDKSEGLTQTKGAEVASSNGEQSKVQTKNWNPLSSGSSLIPKATSEYGMTIGDVKLSDKAKDYYGELKKKFGNNEFILVSQDMKSQVQANAAAYGNANKMVVLIDDAKLEMMANDESYRKKYEGIIAMAQGQMAEAKNSLASSGANVKNFGMSVNADGTTDFFATMEKATEEQNKRLEKKIAEKKQQKIKDKKLADKKAKEKQLEHIKEERKAKEKALEDKREEDAEVVDNKDYVEMHASSMEELLDKVSSYAYSKSSQNVMTEQEKQVGQHFDFKG